MVHLTALSCVLHLLPSCAADLLSHLSFFCWTMSWKQQIELLLHWQLCPLLMCALPSHREDSAVYLSGLGTVGLEVYEQVPNLDAVIFPAGGHCGLLAGSAAALKHLNPHISVIVSCLSPIKHRVWVAFTTTVYKRHLVTLAETACAGDRNYLISWALPQRRPCKNQGGSCSLAVWLDLRENFGKTFPKQIKSSSVFWNKFLPEKIGPK